MESAAKDAAHLPLDKQVAILRTILATNPTLIEVLRRATALDLPNWYLAGGSLSQTVWNHLTGQPAETGIQDYDLVYFDDADLSYEAEDRAIREGEALFAGLAAPVEIRNQARVHLWYEAKFGTPCPAHCSTEAAIACWASTSAMVGVRVLPPLPGLEKEGSGSSSSSGDDVTAARWEVYAPRGLSDVFDLVVRPCARVAGKEAYEKKVRRWKGVWPSLRVIPWPDHGE